MKGVLFLSLCLNLVLGYLYFQKPEEKPPLERTIIETHPKVIEKKVVVEVPVEKKLETKETKDAPPSFDTAVMEDSLTKVQSDKEEFLSQNLGMTPEEIKNIEKIKKKYSDRYMQAFPANHYGDLTIEQRRQLLALEEQREQELSRAFGQRRWNDFQKFRNEYNAKMMKKQAREEGVIVPMDL